MYNSILITTSLISLNILQIAKNYFLSLSISDI